MQASRRRVGGGRVHAARQSGVVNPGLAARLMTNELEVNVAHHLTVRSSSGDDSDPHNRARARSGLAVGEAGPSVKTAARNMGTTGPMLAFPLLAKRCSTCPESPKSHVRLPRCERSSSQMAGATTSLGLWPLRERSGADPVDRLPHRYPNPLVPLLESCREWLPDVVHMHCHVMLLSSM